jgi:DNA-binding NtrC family response regulator
VKPRLLMVDDEPDVRLGFTLYLAKAGFTVLEASSLAEARQLIVSNPVEGVLLDLNLPDGNGLDWIAEVREGQPGTAIVVITGKGDIPIAVEAMRRGADHFLSKPVNMGELEIVLQKGLEVGGLRRSSQAQRRLSKKAQPLFGGSAAMRSLLDLATLAAENDSPVLLQGETGVGKGVLARWIHEHSPREAMPFVELSCAGLRGELIASELFGHARGAFTSAVADRQGLLDIADGGTLFLDEIGELDPGVQSQFLTVLEEKRYRRLGDVRERRSAFRLVCASNRDLAADVETGRFRADLRYRINVFPIAIPPLRGRPEDIPGLAANVLESLGSPQVGVSPEAMALLRGYPWPGNVRELKNALERALLLSRRETLEPEHFSWLRAAPLPDFGGGGARADLDRIQAALREHGGNVEQAASALGMSRATLYRRLQKARSL